MTPILQPIIFFGTEDFSALSLRALIAVGYPVAGVVTKPDSRKGRGQALMQPLVKTVAVAHNIPVWQPQKLPNLVQKLEQFENPVGVLVSYGKIIPQSVIDIFKPGIINVHPSLLPKYRGPSPIESAIVNGDQETGVSVMQLTSRMDAGPVYAYAPLELTGHETRPELYRTLGELGAQVLVAILPEILDGSASPQPQDEEAATYCRLLQKNDTLLQPSLHTATACERIIRAHIGFPKTKIHIHTYDLVVTKAHVSLQKKTPLDLECLDGAYLSLDELIAPSGKVMDAAAFLRGYPLA